MHSHVDFLASKGYLAVSFDPPGTWESGGDIGQYTMTNYLQAINELIEHFGNRPTLLVGHSRGGSMAMLAGCRNAHVDRFVAIMSSPHASGVHSKVRGSIEVAYRDTPPNDREHKVAFKLPMSYFDDAAKYDMREELAACTKPKLFFLGLQDVIVKPESVRTTFALAAEPKELYELDASHDYRRYPDKIEEVNKALGAFLAKYD